MVKQTYDFNTNKLNIYLIKEKYNTPQLLDQKVSDAKLIFRVVLSSILG